MKTTPTLVAALAGAALSASASAQFVDFCLSAPGVSEGVYTFDLAAATNDYPGTCGSTAAAPDQWLLYIAGGNGTATVSTCGLSTGDTVLTVLADGCYGTQVLCEDDTCDLQSSASFAVTAGRVYAIRIAGYAGSRPAGMVSITRPNDLCNDATTVGEGLYSFDNTAAGTEVVSSCGINTGQDVWYRFTAPGTGTVTASTCGLTAIDTVLSAYDGCGGAELACNDDSSCGTPYRTIASEISVPMIAGASILVRLAGYNHDSGTGQVRFTFDSVDSCDDAVTVTDGTHPFDTRSAANDGGSACAGQNDVWFRYQSGVQGWLTAATCGLAGFDTVLSILDGCGGTLLGCSDDACGLQSRVAVPVQPGEVRLVRVAGFYGARGAGQVQIEARSNDQCADALPVTDGVYAFDTLAATTDGPAGCVPMGSNIWYRFDAPALGRLNVTTCGLTNSDTVLMALDGCGGPVLACSDDAFCSPTYAASSISVPVQRDGRTLISLGGYLGSRGTGSVRFEFIPCRIDFNGDGFVDFFDYDDYVNCFETGNCPPGRTADFNGDDFVDFFDYDDFVANFEAGC